MRGTWLDRRAARRAVVAAASALAVLGGTMLGATAAHADAPCTASVDAVEPTDGAAPVSGCTSSSDALESVRLITSTSTVYPAAAGYSRSIVRFSIRGLTSASTGVHITGEAVLRKGEQVVTTWPIDDSTTVLTWDGRNGSEVDPGRYTLAVTAWSSDGSRATSTMSVRVSAKHLVTRTVSMRTRDLSSARTDTLPVAVMKGFRYGKVTLRIHTVAKVRGPARLVISGPYGERFSVPLRNGRHVTKSAVLPPEFTSAAFHHRWKRGAAELLDLYTVFTYKQLV